jgi:hypothetical protein
VQTVALGRGMMKICPLIHLYTDEVKRSNNFFFLLNRRNCLRGQRRDDTITPNGTLSPSIA